MFGFFQYKREPLSNFVRLEPVKPYKEIVLSDSHYGIVFHKKDVDILIDMLIEYKLFTDSGIKPKNIKIRNE